MGIKRLTTARHRNICSRKQVDLSELAGRPETEAAMERRRDGGPLSGDRQRARWTRRQLDWMRSLRVRWTNRKATAR